MNALTTKTARPSVMSASDALSPELWRRLTDDRLPFADAVIALRNAPGLEHAAHILAQSVAPCGGPFVIATLTPLLTLYGVTDRSQSEWATFWRFYVDALGDMPAEAVKAGVADYVNDAKSDFFPRPGPLKARCDIRAVPVRMAESRARKALERQ